MKKIIILLFFLFSSVAFAEENIALENFSPNFHDKASIQRGAKFFSTICMACHTLIYLRYDKLAQDAGVVYDRMPTKITQWPFGVTPPDLSLEVSRRGASWVYTYLHSFYVDTTRPTGVNNLLVHDTAMSGILMPLQGSQILASGVKINGRYAREYQWYDLVVLQAPGSLTSEQFDATIADVVNFLAYASEPYKLKQQRLGLFVIGFLIILFVLVYLLKREYWKDIEK